MQLAFQKICQGIANGGHGVSGVPAVGNVLGEQDQDQGCPDLP